MQKINVKVSVKITVRDCPKAKNIEKKKSLHLLVIDAQLGFQIFGQRFKIRVYHRASISKPSQGLPMITEEPLCCDKWDRTKFALVIIIVILFIWGVIAAVLLACPNFNCTSATNHTNQTTEPTPRDLFLNQSFFTSVEE